MVQPLSFKKYSHRLEFAGSSLKNCLFSIRKFLFKTSQKYFTLFTLNCQFCFFYTLFICTSNLCLLFLYTVNDKSFYFLEISATILHAYNQLLALSRIFTISTFLRKRYLLCEKCHSNKLFKISNNLFIKTINCTGKAEWFWNFLKLQITTNFFNSIYVALTTRLHIGILMKKIGAPINEIKR